MDSQKLNLDAVRAKLAEATKGPVFQMKFKNIRDVDLRQRKQTSNFNQTAVTTSAIAFNNTINNISECLDENSQEVPCDSKIKLILTQAKEQYDNNNMSREQYNNLIKQMIHIKEKQKQEEQRRESIKRKLLAKISSNSS